MAHVSNNNGNDFIENQFPPPYPQPSAPQLMPYLEKHVVNKSIVISQNHSARHLKFGGKLMGLGITEIVTGIIAIIIGIIEITVVLRGPFRISDFSVHIGTPWWTGILFIIAGSLAAAVESDPTLPLIRGCLAMNVISAIACLPGVVIYCINLAYPVCFPLYYCYYHQGTIPCLVILLILTLLNAAISIAVSSFNCKSLNCCCATPNPTVVVVNNAVARPIPQQNFYVNPPPNNIYAMGNIQIG